MADKTDSAPRLAAPVHYAGVVYPAGAEAGTDALPDEIAAKITNKKAWLDGRLPTAPDATGAAATPPILGGDSEKKTTPTKQTGKQTG